MRAAIAIATLLLGACAGGPPAPEWQSSAHAALRGYASAYLEGRTRAADQEFLRARRALAATGSADLVARAELVRCAVRVASLEFDGCPGFVALAADAGAGNRAYAAYLAGEARGEDVALLPEQHREVATLGEAGLAAIADPLAREIAAGVIFRQARLSPQGIALAVDTASANGWRRPLLAWLGVQRKRAEAAGDHEAAAAIERRMRLVTGEDGAR
jgi:hypothetical protein